MLCIDEPLKCLHQIRKHKLNSQGSGWIKPNYIFGNRGQGREDGGLGSRANMSVSSNWLLHQILGCSARCWQVLHWIGWAGQLIGLQFAPVSVDFILDFKLECIFRPRIELTDLNNWLDQSGRHPASLSASAACILTFLSLWLHRTSTWVIVCLVYTGSMNTDKCNVCTALALSEEIFLMRGRETE